MSSSPLQKLPRDLNEQFQQSLMNANEFTNTDSFPKA